MTKHAVIAITLLAVGALTAPVEGGRNTQKLLAAACERTCPEGLQLAACLSEIALCQTKVGLYETYMSQLGAGASLKTLPAAYVQVLQPLYSGVTLQAYLYGYSPRQPAVATTGPIGRAATAAAKGKTKHRMPKIPRTRDHQAARGLVDREPRLRQADFRA